MLFRLDAKPILTVPQIKKDAFPLNFFNCTGYNVA